MFERRLKIFLSIIFALAALMVLRAIQLQMFQRARWQAKAEEAMRHWTLVDTPRGRIVDRNSEPIAYDDACIDAAVDYRAIILDPEWIKSQARQRLKARGEPLAAGMTREQVLADEIERVKADIDAMWALLARVSGKSVEQIEETRQEIMRRVLLLRRNAWYRRYAKTTGKEGPSPWYRRWLVDARTDDPDQQHDAALDAAAITVDEQLQAHVVLAEIDNDVQNALGKKLPDCPGLQLRESTHRKYDPTAAVVACHLLGHLMPVDEQTVKSESNAASDPFRKYLPRDLIGRAGLEGLAEPILRGTKGQLLRSLGNRTPIESIKPVPGGNVMASIDIRLQADVLKLFKEVSTTNRDNAQEILHELHGAAVVLDVRTNEVLVMASYPTFDMNRFDADYAKLAADEINSPLLNRATLGQHEPGSTVKTIIGSVGISTDVVRYNEGIECTGYLIVQDRRTGQMIRMRGTNRCWIASQYSGDPHVPIAHHQVPYKAPHKGRYGNPDGSLVVADALERSCNVFFESVADRMHLVGVTEALSRFGLGQRTGIGIPEATGRIPKLTPLAPGARYESEFDRHMAWLAGIGQGQVLATPLQMANVASSLARGGIWMRPRLLTGASAAAIYKRLPDDPRDLKLTKLALSSVKEGMVNVVHGDAGTGKEPDKLGILVAAKTGSAQASKFSIPLRDPAGHELREPDEHGVEGKGRILRRVFEPGTKERPSELPWYYQGVGIDGEHLAHAWFIGYAPADNPKIAFCVFVEYGGSGGQVAGAIARDVIAACIQHGYLQPGNPSKATAGMDRN
jgi:penicillin-binding protein 2